MMQRNRSLFSVALLLLFLLFAGCRTDGADAPLPSSDSAECTTETPPDPVAEPSEDALALTRDGQPLYAFVYQQTDIPEGISSGDYAKLARMIAADWEEKSGIAFRVWSDRRIPADIGGVIAVGNVSGYAGDAFDSLRYNDFCVSGDFGCITIAGYTESALWLASQQMNDALFLQDGELYLEKRALSVSYHATYAVGSLTIGGQSVSDYRVDYTEEEKSFAGQLTELIRNSSGDVLTVAKDTDGKRIVIRKAEGLNGYRISRAGTEYRLEYGDGLSETLLRLYLENRFANVTGGDTLELDSLVTISERNGERKILSFNVLNVWSKGATPGTRDDTAAAMVLSYLPDFVCLQEYDIGYRQAAGGFSSLIGASYSEVAVAGIDPNDIWNPIFYLTDRYTVAESGYLNLADAAGAAESVNYSGTADGISRFRSLVWVVLRDRADGSLYLVGNFHASLPLETHPAEAQVVSDALNGVADRYDECVTLLCGDYNSRRTQSGGVLEQLRQRGFTDTYDGATIRNDSGTWHNLGKVPGGTYRSDAIDHILTRGGITPQVYLILIDEKYLTASDHCPTILAFTKS